MGPEDDMFPAQEALLHIQTRIVDLTPGKENTITTRLLVQSDEVGCLEGSGESLSEIRKLSGADVQILPREEHPVCILGSDEIIQVYSDTHHEKFDSSMYSSYNIDINSEHQAMFLTKRLTEEREKELEIQMRRLSTLNLSESLNANQSYLNRSMEELRLAQDHHEFRMLNVPNSDPTSDGQHPENNNTEPNSNQGPDLPYSPFASRQAASL